MDLVKVTSPPPEQCSVQQYGQGFDMFDMLLLLLLLLFDHFYKGGGVGGGSWGGSWLGAEDRPKGPNKADPAGTSGMQIEDILVCKWQIGDIFCQCAIFVKFSEHEIFKVQSSKPSKWHNAQCAMHIVHCTCGVWRPGWVFVVKMAMEIPAQSCCRQVSSSHNRIGNIRFCISNC